MIKLYKRAAATTFLLLLVGCFTANQTLTAQIAPEPFGKNRIQYKKFDWQYVSTQNFNVYYYAGGRETALRAAEYGEKELKRITSLIGYFPYSKTTLILYSSVADLRQSNIGLNEDRYQTGGETLFLKNKIELAFDGTQTEFKKAISLNVTQLLLNDMMYGGSLKEVLQSSYMLRLPEWFLTGVASYIAEGWNVEMDNYMRDMVAKNKSKKPDALFGRNNQLSGQSVWNYISERYGYTSIQNILNLTRITRDIEVGIASSLNVPYKKFIRDWNNYYTQMNTFPAGQHVTLQAQDQIFRKNRRGFIYSQPVFSPDGTKLAFVENDRGRYKILIKDLRRNRVTTVRKGGYKTPDQKIDFKAPFLAWKTNAQLAISEVKRAQPTYLIHYLDRNNNAVLNNLKAAIFSSETKGILSQFTQVQNIDFSEDGKLMVISAVKNGQSDIYLFRGNTRQPTRITNDLYDDKNVVFLKGQNAIAFSSNRWLDSSGTVNASFDRVLDNYDIFTLDLNSEGVKPKQLTYSISNDLAPISEDAEHLLFLSEESGIRSIYRYNLTTGQRQKVSSLLQNVKMYDYNPVSKTVALVALDKGKEYLYNFKNLSPVTPTKTNRQTTLENRTLQSSVARQTPAPTKAPAGVATETPTNAQPGTGKTINTDNYQFDNEQKAAPTPKQNAIVSQPAGGTGSLQISRPIKYDLRFSINKITTSVYQDPLMDFGVVAEVGMSDMFEDQRINGGVFIKHDLRTSTFYAEYINLKHRYDIHTTFLKQTFIEQFNQVELRYSRQEFSPTISYPLTHNISVRAIPKVIQTRYSKTNILAEADSIDIFANVGGELVFDNSVGTGVNMMEGTRMKIGYTTFKELNDKTKNFNKIYMDLRHYQRLHRQIIWANRLSYGNFMGQSPKRFLLGGVDNWLFQKEDSDNRENGIFNNQAPIDLFYQQFATPMRGFDYNARFGSQFILYNSEIRVPIIQYIFQNAALGSGFFRNLQFTAFTDMGSAYSGSNPFSRKNSFNTQVIGGASGDVDNNPFEAIVVNYRNPFLFGYGVGARTTLLGMYGKIDIGWGEENYVKKGPKVYLSLGYDF